MKLPKVVTLPHPILRTTMAPVEKFDQELASLASTMIQVMHNAEGVGLAANQIGLDARIFVYGVEDPYEMGGKKFPAIPAQAVINPEITVIDDQVEVMEEGCLSIPGVWGPVARPIGIELRAQDLTGAPFTKNLSGYEARIVQHEVDHLNGKLFLDYITDPTKLRRS